MKTLMRKILILAILLSIPWAFSAIGGGSARAAVCCSVCDANYNACIAGCPRPSCVNVCWRIFENCESTCTPGC
jgi:hypothetical protein